jgi:hypothetical protein
MHFKAEGAAILVMPLKFVSKDKLLFLRLDAPLELEGFFEVNLNTRFIILIIGPIERNSSLFELGRVMAACLADDVTILVCIYIIID